MPLLLLEQDVEWPAKRCYIGLVAVSVQEQAEDILVPQLLGGDADLSCTTWLHTTLLGVVIHMCCQHVTLTQAQVRLH